MHNACTSCGFPRASGSLADEIGLCPHCMRHPGCRRRAMGMVRQPINWAPWDRLVGVLSDSLVARLVGCSESLVATRRVWLRGRHVRHTVRAPYPKVRRVRAKWSGSTSPGGDAEPRDPRAGPDVKAELRERLRAALDHPAVTPQQRQQILDLLKHGA